jgi:hypothetical protein
MEMNDNGWMLEETMMNIRQNYDGRQTMDETVTNGGRWRMADHDYDGWRMAITTNGDNNKRQTTTTKDKDGNKS